MVPPVTVRSVFCGASGGAEASNCGSRIGQCHICLSDGARESRRSDFHLYTDTEELLQRISLGGRALGNLHDEDYVPAFSRERGVGLNGKTYDTRAVRLDANRERRHTQHRAARLAT